jgi:hypothetical protein
MLRRAELISTGRQGQCYWKINGKKQKSFHSEISFTAEFSPLVTGAQWS